MFGAIPPLPSPNSSSSSLVVGTKNGSMSKSSNLSKTSCGIASPDVLVRISVGRGGFKKGQKNSTGNNNNDSGNGSNKPSAKPKLSTTGRKAVMTKEEEPWRISSLRIFARRR